MAWQDNNSNPFGVQKTNWTPYKANENQNEAMRGNLVAAMGADPRNVPSPVPARAPVAASAGTGFWDNSFIQRLKGAAPGLVFGGPAAPLVGLSLLRSSDKPAPAPAASGLVGIGGSLGVGASNSVPVTGGGIGFPEEPKPGGKYTKSSELAAAMQQNINSLAAARARVDQSYALQRDQIASQYRLSETKQEKKALAANLADLNNQLKNAVANIGVQYTAAKDIQTSAATQAAAETIAAGESSAGIYQAAAAEAAAGQAAQAAAPTATTVDAAVAGPTADSPTAVIESGLDNAATQAAAAAQVSAADWSNLQASNIQALAAGQAGQNVETTNMFGEATASSRAEHAAQVAARINEERMRQADALQQLEARRLSELNDLDKELRGTQMSYGSAESDRHDNWRGALDSKIDEWKTNNTKMKQLSAMFGGTQEPDEVFNVVSGHSDGKEQTTTVSKNGVLQNLRAAKYTGDPSEFMSAYLKLISGPGGTQTATKIFGPGYSPQIAYQRVG